MNQMTIEGLINLSKSEHGKNSNWMAVELTLPNATGTEIIINPKENIEEKLKYYQQAYSNDLQHKHVDAIKIVNYAFVYSLDELAEELGVEV